MSRLLTSPAQRAPIEYLRPIESPTAGDFRPPEFTDDALALRFAEVHSDDLRYVAAWSQWFEWDGVRWKRDNTLKAFDHARHVCRTASAECNKPRRSAMPCG
jgi:putative DNA primase/helicase